MGLFEDKVDHEDDSVTGHFVTEHFEMTSELPDVPRNLTNYWEASPDLMQVRFKIQGNPASEGS